MHASTLLRSGGLPLPQLFQSWIFQEWKKRDVTPGEPSMQRLSPPPPIRSVAPSPQIAPFLGDFKSLIISSVCLTPEVHPSFSPPKDRPGCSVNSVAPGGKLRHLNGTALQFFYVESALMFVIQYIRGTLGTSRWIKKGGSSPSRETSDSLTPYLCSGTERDHACIPVCYFWDVGHQSQISGCCHFWCELYCGIINTNDSSLFTFMDAGCRLMSTGVDHPLTLRWEKGELPVLGMPLCWDSRVTCLGVSVGLWFAGSRLDGWPY